MPTILSNLEEFFATNEQDDFRSTHIKTSLAIKEFKAVAFTKETGTSLHRFFNEEKSSYTRDTNCIIDFRSLSVAISQIKKRYSLVSREEVLKTFTTNVPHLIESLTLFSNADENEDRKKIYKDALDYLGRIQNCFTDPKPKLDTPDTTSIKPG